ncbi:unnamed protein product, partial [Didymodactylos carnosus]
LDVIIPSEEEAPEIDDEMVEQLLLTKGLHITKVTPVNTQHGIVQFAQREYKSSIVTT